MTTFDPQTVLDSLEAEYAARVTAIRRDLAGSHSADSAEQAGERQNDEVLQAFPKSVEDYAKGKTNAPTFACRMGSRISARGTSRSCGPS